MTHFPRSLIEFQRRFPMSGRVLSIWRGGRWRTASAVRPAGKARAGSCRARHSPGNAPPAPADLVTAGTVMHASKLPLTVWFWAAYLMATHSNGIAALQLQGQLGLGSYKSAWLLAAKLRRAMVAPDVPCWPAWWRSTRQRSLCVAKTNRPPAGTAQPPGQDAGGRRRRGARRWTGRSAARRDPGCFGRKPARLRRSQC